MHETISLIDSKLGKGTPKYLLADLKLNPGGGDECFENGLTGQLHTGFSNECTAALSNLLVSYDIALPSTFHDIHDDSTGGTIQVEVNPELIS